MNPSCHPQGPALRIMHRLKNNHVKSMTRSTGNWRARSYVSWNYQKNSAIELPKLLQFRTDVTNEARRYLIWPDSCISEPVSQRAKLYMRRPSA
jgi:hypothetical protein